MDRVPDEVIRERVERISALQEKTSASRLKNLIGQTMEAVGEGEGWGRTVRDAPEVDGRITVPGLKTEQRLGVRITGSSAHDLEGVITK